ncbi:MAG TPA: hypothetical protein VLA43_02010 [Longimicrobiales bacterium]|nr:hypothetical protein [Longimicrobiales bacterium]
MRPSRLPPTEGAITDAELPRYPLQGLPPERARGLTGLAPGEEGGAASLDALLSGALPGIVTSAHRVPDPLSEELEWVALGPGDRRLALVGGGSPHDLPADTTVTVPDERCRALLRAHHPRLRPVGPDGAARHAVVALWQHPGAEARGELLEQDSWLPRAGEGIPVLLRRAGGPGLPEGDPAAMAALRAERAVARAFPGAILCVRGQPFGARLRLQALILSPDGTRAVRGETQGPQDLAEDVARELADLLDARGARLFTPPSPR